MFIWPIGGRQCTITCVSAWWLREKPAIFERRDSDLKLLQRLLGEGQNVLCRPRDGCGQRVCDTNPPSFTSSNPISGFQISLMQPKFSLFLPQQNLALPPPANSTDQESEVACLLRLACDGVFSRPSRCASGPTWTGLQSDKSKVVCELESCMCRDLSCYHDHRFSSSELCQIVDQTTMDT